MNTWVRYLSALSLRTPGASLLGPLSLGLFPWAYGSTWLVCIRDVQLHHSLQAIEHRSSQPAGMHSDRAHCTRGAIRAVFDTLDLHFFTMISTIEYLAWHNGRIKNNITLIGEIGLTFACIGRHWPIQIYLANGSFSTANELWQYLGTFIARVQHPQPGVSCKWFAGLIYWPLGSNRKAVRDHLDLVSSGGAARDGWWTVHGLGYTIDALVRQPDYTS